jgi:hypothetical protein
MIANRKEMYSHNGNDYRFSLKNVIRKGISISFAIFTMSTLLMASTVAFAANSTSSTANFGATKVNNNNVVQKQEQ